MNMPLKSQRSLLKEYWKKLIARAIYLRNKVEKNLETGQFVEKKRAS